jgi:hypothetical protein
MTETQYPVTAAMVFARSKSIGIAPNKANAREKTNAATAFSTLVRFATMATLSITMAATPTAQSKTLHICALLDSPANASLCVATRALNRAKNAMTATPQLEMAAVPAASLKMAGYVPNLAQPASALHSAVMALSNPR